jgi:hypothetical protein
MGEQTWGYSGEVGAWHSSFRLPDEGMSSPIGAVLRLLELVTPILAENHRPRSMKISWVEYSPPREEVAFHELDEVTASDWSSVTSHIQNLKTRTQNQVAVSCIFLQLDTRLIDVEQTEHWAVHSGEFQISVDDELAPTQPTIAYRTFIDIWLSATYSENKALRANRRLAVANRPQLKRLLIALGHAAGKRLVADVSGLYGPAITDTGFVDVDPHKVADSSNSPEPGHAMLPRNAVRGNDRPSAPIFGGRGVCSS